MKNKTKWETNSLEWIHQVRKEMDEEIQAKGITVGQWIKSRKKADIDSLCRKLGLTNLQIGLTAKEKAGKYSAKRMGKK